MLWHLASSFELTFAAHVSLSSGWTLRSLPYPRQATSTSSESSKFQSSTSAVKSPGLSFLTLRPSAGSQQTSQCSKQRQEDADAQPNVRSRLIAQRLLRNCEGVIEYWYCPCICEVFRPRPPVQIPHVPTPSLNLTNDWASEKAHAMPAHLQHGWRPARKCESPSKAVTILCQQKPTWTAPIADRHGHYLTEGSTALPFRP